MESAGLFFLLKKGKKGRFVYIATRRIKINPFKMDFRDPRIVKGKLRNDGTFLQ